MWLILWQMSPKYNTHTAELLSRFPSLNNGTIAAMMAQGTGQRSLREAIYLVLNEQAQHSWQRRPDCGHTNSSSELREKLKTLKWNSNWKLKAMFLQDLGSCGCRRESISWHIITFSPPFSLRFPSSRKKKYLVISASLSNSYSLISTLTSPVWEMNQQFSSQML